MGTELNINKYGDKMQIQCTEKMAGDICAISKLIPGKKGRRHCAARFNHKTGVCYAKDENKRFGLKCPCYTPESTI